MTWGRVLFAAVLIALLGSAASLWAREPLGADDVYRKAESVRCVCR